MPRRDELRVDLPDDLSAWMLRQVEAGGFGTPSEYIRHLLRLARATSSVDEIEARLIAAEKSGPAIRPTKKDWDDLVKRGDARVAAIRRGAAGKARRRSA
jgi:putative addiction module CopG family antidote